MKKITIALMLLIAAGTVSAETLSTVNSTTSAKARIETGVKPELHVPLIVTDAYNSMYPGAQTIKWQRKGESILRVVFVYNGEKLTASCTLEGAYIGK